MLKKIFLKIVLNIWLTDKKVMEIPKNYKKTEEDLTKRVTYRQYLKRDSLIIFENLWKN